MTLIVAYVIFPIVVIVLAAVWIYYIDAKCDGGGR